MPYGAIEINTGKTMQFCDLTGRLGEALAANGVKEGICHLYNPHTTAGLTINEGADPAVQSDIINALRRMVPGDGHRHAEGNSPAHVMASLMGSSVTIFIENGRLKLGVWQKIFFCEFDGPRSRKVFWRIA